jgi:hypothetical protein
MPFNINTFKTEIANYGYLQTNKYQVYVTPPPLLTGTSLSVPSAPDLGQTALSNIVSITDISQRLMFRAESINVPSVSLAIQDVNRYGVGIAQKQPYNASFNTLNMTFISDGYGEIWQFWYQWMQSIFQFSGSDTSTAGGGGSISNNSGNYSLQYKDQYSTTITLNMFDNYGNLAQAIDYTQAYPYAVNDIQLNWNDSNQLLKINVAIAFTDFMIQNSSIAANAVAF